MSNICVIGDLILDVYVFGEVRRISPEAPIPVLQRKGTEFRLGGAANVANNIVALGGTVSLLGAVSDDSNGAKLRELLLSSKVNNLYVEEDLDVTTCKTRYISGNHQLMRLDVESQSPYDNRVLEKKFFEVYKSVQQEMLDAVVVSDYNKGVVGRNSNFIKKLTAGGITSFVDPKKKDWSCYRGATVVCPNYQEFCELCEANELEHVAAARLCENYNIDFMCITKGADGYVVYTRDGLLCRASSVARDVYDVSGAGDTFIAALAKFWPHEDKNNLEKIRKAFEVANIAAGISVTKLGTSPVYLHELMEHQDNNLNFRRKKKYYSDWFEFKNNILETDLSDVVFTNGCFDIIHSGHVEFLSECKRNFKHVVVCLNTDASISRIKGKNRPVNALCDRIRVLESLECVDAILVFDEDTPLEIYEFLQPHFIAKGGDYRREDVVGFDVVRNNGGDICIYQYKNNRSSSSVIEKIKGMA